MRTVLSALGIVLAVVGLLWIGQGSGYFPYPASSFMISQRPWLMRGVILMVVGLGLVVLSRRVR